MTIHVLDHGYVRLANHMGDDSSIVRSARVSYNAHNSDKDEIRDTKLISYLMRNGHNTPFESVAVTLEVKAPIFVIRQWMRHRTMSYNEVSARYTELEGDYYLPRPEHIGFQDKENKQKRVLGPNENSEAILRAYKANMEMAKKDYEFLLDETCPRELARAVIPTAFYSKMIVTANLNNWFRFLRERLHASTQYETRMYATAAMELIRPIAPVACEAFENTLEGQDYD